MRSTVVYLGLAAVLLPACATALTTRGPSPGPSSEEATFLPGVAGLRLGGLDGEHIKGLNEAAVIQMTYDALAAAAARSGHEINFDLAEFETFYRENFPHLLLSDLMSVPSKTLRIDYTEVDHAEDGEDIFLGATYEPSWRALEGDSTKTMREMATWTYAEILRMAENDSENQSDDFRQTVAVTTYKVQATFEGESVDYRTLFVWLADEEGVVRFYPQDNVTELVDEIWSLSPQAAPLSQLLRGEPAGAEPVGRRSERVTFTLNMR